MLKYFLLFSLLGWLVAKIVDDIRSVFIIYFLIAIMWGAFTAPIWGFVAFGELFVGYSFAFIFKSKY
jgi:hypothetical protein